MTINAHGNFAKAEIDFRCGVCGCDFTTENNEFQLDTGDSGRIYCAKCPECGYNIRTTRNGVYVHYNFEEKEN